MNTYDTAQVLIKKAVSRSNLNRTEQRQLGEMLDDKIKQCTYQSNMIKEMRAEIIRLKIVNKGET